ncbi:nuclear transport factor 2 family protein [Terasakiella pusilla]|jgi:hypothetical protein|uniref:nuclear transport factor 2 family protein n=1 Tax=Terasakiella pusilla TaxID=64973 RepID=UPI00048E1E94|nr:nuclear transport factor 2 family protein [Terasakiella pusilla]
MLSRVKTLAVTKEYIDAFNRRDLRAIENLLAPTDVSFVRQSQPTIVGVSQIIRRTQKTFDRLDRQGHQLHMISGIIDFKNIMAHPCMIGILDGERASVVILDVKNNSKISNISIVMTKDMLAKARPTEPMAQEKIETLHRMKPVISDAELRERREGLQDKAKKLKERFEKEGPTQALLGKLERLKEAQRKLKKLEEDLKLAKSVKGDNL